MTEEGYKEAAQNVTAWYREPWARSSMAPDEGSICHMGQ